MRDSRAAVRNTITFLADRFFLLRPLVIVPALTFFLLGYAEALLRRREAWPGHPGLGHPWLGLVSYALVMASVYVVNQVYDAESDRANEKLFLIPRGIVSKREAWAIAAALMVLGLAGGARCGHTTMFLFGLSFVLGMAYSVPPLALKRVFPFDLAANAIGYGMLAFVTGWSVAASPGLKAVAMSEPLALCVGAVFTLTAVQDRKGDERSGFRTTGVTLGLGRGPLLALVLMAVAIPLSFMLDNRFVLVGAAVSTPFFVYACARRDDRSVRVAYRASSAVFILMVGFAFPYFLLMVLALMGLARLYYSRRFSLGYPTLTGK
jgi:4-hydroxybenzoate polyprenyltransferase